VNRRELLLAAAALPIVLARAPASLAALSNPRALALVTADLESHVVAFDLHSRRVVRRIETLPGPKSIETVGGGSTALVAHTAAGAISLVDVATLRVRAVLNGFTEPRYTAAAPDGRHAFVTDAGRGEVVTVDLGRARIVGRAEVGTHARHLSLDPRSGRLWTALGFSAPAIVALDVAEPTRPRVTARIETPFAAHDVVFAPAGGRVWVSSGEERRLVVYRAATRRPLFTLEAGRPPQHIAFDARAAYVTSDDAVRVHAIDDGRLLRETTVPDGSYNVTHALSFVATPSLDSGILSLLDTSGRLLAHPRLARATHDACLVRRT
jgi:DNA-binding beta-propeller fold protein YncE